MNHSCYLCLCVFLSHLRSSRSCRFTSWSTCFCSSEQQRSHHLHHLPHHLHHLPHLDRHQSIECSRASPQPTLQLRGNHHQHHQAGLHWWVVSDRLRNHWESLFEVIYVQCFISCLQFILLRSFSRYIFTKYRSLKIDTNVVDANTSSAINHVALVAWGT